MKYSHHLAAELGMGAEFGNSLLHASPPHDITKFGIPVQDVFREIYDSRADRAKESSFQLSVKSQTRN